MKRRFLALQRPVLAEVAGSSLELHLVVCGHVAYSADSSRLPGRRCPTSPSATARKPVPEREGDVAPGWQVLFWQSVERM